MNWAQDVEELRAHINLVIDRHHGEDKKAVISYLLSDMLSLAMVFDVLPPDIQPTVMFDPRC